ncbi:phage head closure protein [Desulfovibrio porci]|uniref:phage head closure protein n=1 Tax=Desulfovibrio porci TaxID=2605782 RepID=UPI003A8C8FC9
MRAGALRHQVTLQRFVRGQDAYGGPVEEWVDVATVWASLEAMNGREFFASQQTQSEVTQRIRIRYMPGVAADMRVVHQGTVFNIVAPLPDNRQREIVLMCKELSHEQASA